MTIRHPRAEFAALTDPNQERNIYTHPNPLARDIFWQRLEHLLAGMQKTCGKPTSILDFGGGSGGFLKGLTSAYPDCQLDVVDLDPGDALRVQLHLASENPSTVKNTKITTADLKTWEGGPYDVIVATDVLEHFENLTVPLNIIRRLLKPSGKLCISVPTENWIYLLGRKLVRKTKPADHYHPSENILLFLKKAGFLPVWETYAPKYLVPVPLFHLAVLTHKATTEKN